MSNMKQAILNDPAVPQDELPYGTDSTDSTDNGLKKTEAITSVWTKTSLAISYIGLVPPSKAQ